MQPTNRKDEASRIGLETVELNRREVDIVKCEVALVEHEKELEEEVYSTNAKVWLLQKSRRYRKKMLQQVGCWKH